MSAGSERLRWAVDQLHVQPKDRIFENSVNVDQQQAAFCVTASPG
jgi:hypothetical protein